MQQQTSCCYPTSPNIPCPALPCLCPPPAVCPRGTFESATGCTRCPMNQFCSGGDKVENPASRGTNTTCGTNLVTRNTGARTQSDCLAPGGFARTSPAAATPCARSEYAPALNRLSKCLRCQSGLEEPINSGLANSDRDTKRKVCSEYHRWPWSYTSLKQLAVRMFPQPQHSLSCCTSSITSEAYQCMRCD
jgi:hypothetical protein